jgi:stage II sporulation protein P
LSSPPENEEPALSTLFSTACKLAARVDPAKPGLLRSVLPVVDVADTVVLAAPAAILTVAPQREEADPPFVAIYNTHTGETYALTDGVERVKGAGGVVQAAAVLEEGLKNRNIAVLRSDKVHDVSYAASYLESEKTVRDFVYLNPELDGIFDVHRDSTLPRGRATVNIQGRDVARVLIIVGSDERQPFPAWRQNLEFAERIAAQADALYPGLCAGVRVKAGRYNQYLSPRALLLEIGGVNNTLEEAEIAAMLFADVLADVLQALKEEDKAAANRMQPSPLLRNNSSHSGG